MAYIYKPTPTNWYYCIEENDGILPSQIPDVLRCNWLSFSPERNKGVYTQSDVDEDVENFESEIITGKWMIWPDYPDALWPALLHATAASKSGISIKAATPYNRSGNKLICVYTRDWRDKEDIERVLAGLRDLGILPRINYKRDIDTLAGKAGSIWTSDPGSRQMHRPQNYRG